MSFIKNINFNGKNKSILKVFLIMFILIGGINNNVHTTSVKFKIFLRSFNKLFNALFAATPSYTPPYIYSHAITAIQELFDQKKLDYNFALINNKIQKRDEEINRGLNNIIKNIVNAIKNVIVKEIEYRKRKRDVYNVYIPTTYNKNAGTTINCQQDFDLLLKRMKSSLVFSEKQKQKITVILMQMQRNILMLKKHMQNSKITGKKVSKAKLRYYTTQLFLAGPPGTAKTQLAYLCSEVTGLPLIALSISSLTLMGKDAIRTLAEIIQETKNEFCILLIDETELLLMNRNEILGHSTSSSSSKSSKKTNFSAVIHDLLTVFLSLTGAKGLNIIAATNKPDIIDSAIRRRFEHMLNMELPAEHIRAKIFLQYFTQFNIQFSDATILKASEIGAIYTGGTSQGEEGEEVISFSGSEIKTICTQITEMNRPMKLPNGKIVTISNTGELNNTIQNRKGIHRLFSTNVRMSGAGGIIEDDYDINDNQILINERKIMEKYRRKTQENSIKVRFELMGKIMICLNDTVINNYKTQIKEKFTNKTNKINLISKNPHITLESFYQEVLPESDSMSMSLLTRKRNPRILIGDDNPNKMINMGELNVLEEQNKNKPIILNKKISDSKQHILNSIVDNMEKQNVESEKKTFQSVAISNKVNKNLDNNNEKSLFKSLKNNF